MRLLRLLLSTHLRLLAHTWSQHRLLLLLDHRLLLLLLLLRCHSRRHLGSHASTRSLLLHALLLQHHLLLLSFERSNSLLDVQHFLLGLRSLRHVVKLIDLLLELVYLHV